MGLREKIEELLEMSVDDISPENTLLELGMDSIKLVELAGSKKIQMSYYTKTISTRLMGNGYTNC